MTISSEEYRQLGRALAGTVCVVATQPVDNGPVAGLTVSSFVTLSLEPALVMFAMHRDATSHPVLAASRAFGVSVLQLRQREIAQSFAAKGADKARHVDLETGRVLPVPLIRGSLVHVECSTRQVIEAGDHSIVIGLVEALRQHAGEPLLYFARQYGAFTPLPEG